MPLDGITAANIVSELKGKIKGGKIDKIYQPERNSLIMQIRSGGENHRLLLSAEPSNPRVHLTALPRENPETAPQFCMFLRKILSGGRITDIIQPDFERIIILNIESANEMGDITEKNLIIEIMGKHSNIILVKDGVILDSIKRVSKEKSSVREVLPGLNYVYPPSKNKKNPIKINEKEFFGILSAGEAPLETVIYSSYNGISPAAASDIAARSGTDAQALPNAMSVSAKTKVYTEFLKLIADVVTERFSPAIYFGAKGNAVDFASVPLKIYESFESKHYDSISALMDDYYASKDSARIKAQKSADLKKLITQNLERNAKKREIQLNTLKEVKNRNRLKLYGDLLTANIYLLKPGMTTIKLANFYDTSGTAAQTDGFLQPDIAAQTDGFLQPGTAAQPEGFPNYPEIEIALDSQLTPSENAQKYYKKYNKEKRTYSATIEQLKQTDDERLYLEQILQLTDTCETEADLADIRQELFEQGYVKKNAQKKDGKAKKSKPMHFVSSDGFDIYVGKNSKQNEEITLKNASNADMWLHTKNIPGSHVIIKTNGKELPNSTLNEGAILACFFSKGRNSQLVGVDYTLKKHVKKPTGAKVGMVIYDNFKTAFVTADEELVNAIKRVS
ncbi:MAG: NFACT family protein [Clostridiales bacterium]|jgi:predicted ribosome quality control (RQC) complex YloA/Tae2 family protein|nr:NFACT family protein [Clostridiales bacterium]